MDATWAACGSEAHGFGIADTLSEAEELPYALKRNGYRDSKDSGSVKSWPPFGMGFAPSKDYRCHFQLPDKR